MKVMKIVLEVDDFDCLLAKDDSFAQNRYFHLNGSSKLALWPKTMEMYRYDLTRPMPDLVDCGCGNLGVWKRSLELLKPYLKNVELLPFTSTFGDGFIINLTDFVDCLREEECQWEDEDKLIFSRFEFNREAIPVSLMFKVPQEPFELFCTDEIHNPKSLYAIAREEDLTGARFEVVWEG